MTPEQHLTAELIEQIMCHGRIDLDRLTRAEGSDMPVRRQRLMALAREFAPLATLTGNSLHVEKEAFPLLRIIAARLDDGTLDGSAHATAV